MSSSRDAEIHASPTTSRRGRHPALGQPQLQQGSAIFFQESPRQPRLTRVARTGGRGRNVYAGTPPGLAAGLLLAGCGQSRAATEHAQTTVSSVATTVSPLTPLRDRGDLVQVEDRRPGHQQPHVDASSARQTAGSRAPTIVNGREPGLHLQPADEQQPTRRPRQSAPRRSCRSTSILLPRRASPTRNRDDRSCR